MNALYCTHNIQKTVLYNELPFGLSKFGPKSARLLYDAHVQQTYYMRAREYALPAAVPPTSIIRKIKWLLLYGFCSEYRLSLGLKLNVCRPKANNNPIKIRNLSDIYFANTNNIESRLKTKI